jgi:hypothetical protein
MFPRTAGTSCRTLISIVRGQGGARGNRKLGDSGDAGKSELRRVAEAVGVGLDEKMGETGEYSTSTAHVDSIGDTMKPGDIAISNMDNGDDGRSGEARWNSDCGCGGIKNGLIGEEGY